MTVSSRLAAARAGPGYRDVGAGRLQLDSQSAGRHHAHVDSTTATTSAAASPTTGSSASTTASVEIGNTVNYGSMGTTTTLDCASGKSLNVAGSDNTLTVTGTCATASIGGTNNKITFDKVETRITVLGLNNTITYKDGDPKVDNLGSGNTITKGS